MLAKCKGKAEMKMLANFLVSSLGILAGIFLAWWLIRRLLKTSTRTCLVLLFLSPFWFPPILFILLIGPDVIMASASMGRYAPRTAVVEDTSNQCEFMVEIKKVGYFSDQSHKASIVFKSGKRSDIHNVHPDSHESFDIWRITPDEYCLRATDGWGGNHSVEYHVNIMNETVEEIHFNDSPQTDEDNVKPCEASCDYIGRIEGFYNPHFVSFQSGEAEGGDDVSR